MNYLRTNLYNSKLLPYDIMKLIYEYADPLLQIRFQIENKYYDLDEIMYKRMKKEIIYNFNSKYHILYNNNWFFIDKNNIDNILYRDVIINGNCGYKKFFLWKHKSPTRICNIGSDFDEYYKRYRMIKDLEEVKPCVNYGIKSFKQIYRLWKKL